MRRNLQLLNVKYVWIYVYIMNGSRLGFHDVSCGVHIFTSSERFTMRQDLLFFSSTSHQGVQEKVNMAPSGAIIYLLFVLDVISSLPSIEKNARVSSCF